MLPQGDPLCVKSHKIKNRVEIAHGLDGYIQHWTDMSNEDGTAAYKAHMLHLVTYTVVYCVMTDPASSQRHDKIGMMMARHRDGPYRYYDGGDKWHNCTVTLGRPR